MSLSAYTAKTWVDYADAPDLSAANLQYIDSGVAAVTAEVLALEAALPTTYQPISAELSALAALSSTGYAKRTGAAAWSVVPSIPQSDVAGLTAALAGLQPLDSDLTAIAALTTTAFGRSLLTAADAAVARTLLGAQVAGNYLPISGGALTGYLSSVGYIVSNVGASDALASSSRIGMTSSDFAAGWLLSYSASGAMRFSYSAGSQAWSTVLSISTAGVISRGAYALWDAGSLAFGTGASNMARGDHLHAGVYQPVGNYSLVGHSHAITDVAGLQSALDGKQAVGAYATWSGLSQYNIPRAVNAAGLLGNSALSDDGSVVSCSRPMLFASVAASSVAASNTLASASRLGVVTASGVRGMLISLGAAYDMQFWGATTDNSWSKVAGLSATGAFSAAAISRGGYTVWDAGNLVGTRNEHNHAGVYLPLAGGTMGGDINLGGYSITSGSTGLGNGMVSSIGGNFTNLQVVSLFPATGFSYINLGANLVPTTDAGVNLGSSDKRVLAAYSVHSYLSYLDASVEVAGPVMRWKDRIVIGNGGVLPIVGDGCAIVAVGQGTGGVTNKPTTNNYQSVDYRKADGTLATAAAGGNVIDLDLYGRCAFVVGVSSSRAQLIL